jgi:hypothetical protein
MGVVRLCVSSLLRRRVSGMLAVAALIAVAGGVVLAAFAGARRTDTAFPRLLARQHALDLIVSPGPEDTVPATLLRNLPTVTAAGDAYGFGLASWNGRGTRPEGYPQSINGIGFLKDEVPSDAEAPRVTAGHLPRPNHLHDLFLNDRAAQMLGVEVGDIVHYTLYKFEELFNADGSLNGDAEFTPVKFTVVGTGSTLDDLLANENQTTAEGAVSSAFTKRYLDRASFQIAGVFLRNGAQDIPRFTAALNRALGDQRVQLQTLVARERQFQDVTEPYTTALWLFGLAGALAAAVVVAQALTRMVAIDAGDNPVLVALGASGGARRGVAAGRAVFALVVGAVLAVALALALSPIFPLGRARAAEPDPGIRIDGLVLGLGFVAMLLVLTVPVAVAAWRATRRRDVGEEARSARPSYSAERLADAGTPAPVVTGVRFAFRDPTGQRISMAATLTGLVVAVATVVAALTFGTSLDRMVTTPERYGWTWGVLITRRIAAPSRRPSTRSAPTIGSRPSRSGRVAMSSSTASRCRATASTRSAAMPCRRPARAGCRRRPTRSPSARRVSASSGRTSATP